MDGLSDLMSRCFLGFINCFLISSVVLMGSVTSDAVVPIGLMLWFCRPKLTVVVVKKRICSRFFARIDGKLTNPPPGTVIDTEVTRPEWYACVISIHSNTPQLIHQFQIFL